tara:strand:+ start:2966 stop:3697 length:732 start_codon:yes stop_codon:yes gene_type:complete
MNTNKKSFIAIIPARAASKEIKNKNMILFGGHPLVSYSIEAAKKSKFIKEVFVSTDGKKIAKASEKYGAKIIFRPNHMSQDNSKIEDAVLYTIKYLEKNYGKKIDNIVLMQPTSPQRKIYDVDNAIKQFIKSKADSLFSCNNIFPCLWKIRNSKIIPENFNPRKRKNRQDRSQEYIENGSIYVTKKEIYEINKSRLGGKISPYIMDISALAELDTKKDLKYLSLILKPEIRKKFKFVTPKRIK